MQNRITFTPQSPKAFLLSSKAKTINGAVTFGADVSIGANKLLTTNLLLKEISSVLWLRNNPSDNAFQTIRVASLQYDGLISPQANNTKLTAYNTSGSWHLFQAPLTGGSLVEVARLQGASDPYFSTGGSQQFKFFYGGTMEAGGKITSIVASGSPVLAFFPTGDAAPAGSTSGTIALQSGFSGFMEVQLGSGGTPAYIPYFVA